MDEYEDLVERGFQLAHFIFPERTTALRILISAINKLNARRGYETKRAYWRDKYLKGRISRITRSDADALQWLIFFESDHYERQQEHAGTQTESDMVVRYIKFLVQATTAMSSFYVGVGVQRLLYRYSTAETQKGYELIADRYLGSDAYRRAKSTLMNQLEARFGRFLKIKRTESGEFVFESGDQRRWIDLVRQCLVAFMPWSTANNCQMPAHFRPESRSLPHLLSGVGHEKHDQDEIEIHRCHAFICPVCYERLIGSLGFDPPEERLALPRFFTDKSSGTEHDPGRSSRSSALTRKERCTIGNELAANAQRRHRASPETLRILVDGVECARLNLSLGNEIGFEIAEGARLVEVLTRDHDGEFILATCLIPSRHWQATATTSTTLPGGSQKLVLAVMPARRTADGVRAASASLRCVPAPRWFGWVRNQKPVSPRLSAGVKYAFVGLLFGCLAWVLSTARYSGQMASARDHIAAISRELANEKEIRSTLQRELETASRNQAASFRLASDDLRTRSGTGSEVPTVKVYSGQPVINLELPVSMAGRQSYRAALKPLLKDREILAEDLLQPRQTADGPVIVFSVPTSLLHNMEDYTVVVSVTAPGGVANEVDSFTFHLMKLDH